METCPPPHLAHGTCWGGKLHDYNLQLSTNAASEHEVMRQMRGTTLRKHPSSLIMVIGSSRVLGYVTARPQVETAPTPGITGPWSWAAPAINLTSDNTNSTSYCLSVDVGMMVVLGSLTHTHNLLPPNMTSCFTATELCLYFIWSESTFLKEFRFVHKVYQSFKKCTGHWEMPTGL